MGKLNWKIFRCDPDAKLPTIQPGSAGFDLYCCGIGLQVGQQFFTLYPQTGHLFHTGIKCAFTPGYVAILYDRSGLGSKGIHRTAGVIDANYRGEWLVSLFNITNQPVTFKNGDRIAQVIFQELPAVNYGEVANEQLLGLTNRGQDGFGSTGR